MADYFPTDSAEAGLPPRDWLKLAGLFTLFTLLMLLVLSLAVLILTP
jgi:hypothetical protein